VDAIRQPQAHTRATVGRLFVSMGGENHAEPASGSGVFVCHAGCCSAGAPSVAADHRMSGKT
jgi:hypothetical protein